MEQAAQSMAAELLHDAITELAGMCFDRRADVAQARPRLRRRFDAEHEAFVSHIDQLSRLQ